VTIETLPSTTTLWLPLLASLSEASQLNAVSKNADRALAGDGDIDFLAPEEHWDAIELEFLRWARASDLGPVPVCRHVPGALFLVALGDGRGPWFQLDVRARATFRGSTLLRPQDATPLTEMDGRGFRRLRPGAEGLLKLVASGIAPGGRPKPDNLRRERVAELVGRDLAGTRRAAAGFGALAAAAVRAAQAVARGDWDRPSALALEARACARALVEPRVARAQLAARVAKKRCPLVATGIGRGRRVPDERDAWLELVSRTHPVHGYNPSHD
jgi:hypothetical protein